MEEVILKLNKKKFQLWNNFSLNLTLDSIDSLNFEAFSNSRDFLNELRPATFSDIEVFINEEKIFTGKLINRNCAISSRTINFGGYSLPGVLNDLPVPFEAFPLEFLKQDLRQIAKKLADFYKIPVIFKNPPGRVFEEPVGMEPGEKILEFLVKLAQKREMLISNDVDGKLIFFTPGNSKIITPLRQGEIPLQNLSFGSDEQQLFDNVTGLGASLLGRKPEAFTVKIPILGGLKRSYVYKVEEATGAELQKAVRLKAGRLLAGAFSVTATVSGWRNHQKNVWKPDDFVEIYAPSVFFQRETKMMIRNITLNQSETGQSATLGLIFPEIYSGKLLQQLPWGD